MKPHTPHRKQLLISLPVEYWIELEDFAQENKISVDYAASEILLCSIAEWVEDVDLIEQLQVIQDTEEDDEDEEDNDEPS
jgi:hypothetical protein